MSYYGPVGREHRGPRIPDFERSVRSRVPGVGEKTLGIINASEIYSTEKYEPGTVDTDVRLLEDVCLVTHTVFFLATQASSEVDATRLIRTYAETIASKIPDSSQEDIVANSRTLNKAFGTLRRRIRTPDRMQDVRTHLISAFYNVHPASSTKFPEIDYGNPPPFLDVAL